MAVRRASTRGDRAALHARPHRGGRVREVAWEVDLRPRQIRDVHASHQRVVGERLHGRGRPVVLASLADERPRALEEAPGGGGVELQDADVLAVRLAARDLLVDPHEAVVREHHLHVLVLATGARVVGERGALLLRDPAVHERVRERVAVEQHERPRDGLARERERVEAVRVREARVLHVAHARAEARADRVGAEADHDHDAADAELAQRPELVLDQRTTADLDQTLREARSERPQPRATTSGEDHGRRRSAVLHRDLMERVYRRGMRPGVYRRGMRPGVYRRGMRPDPGSTCGPEVHSSLAATSSTRAVPFLPLASLEAARSASSGLPRSTRLTRWPAARIFPARDP